MSDISKLVNGLYPDLFKDIIGQDMAKAKLSFYLRSYANTKTLPNLIFTGQKGNGKTSIGREVANGLIQFDAEGEVEMSAKTGLPKRKPLIEVNCSTLKTVQQFINSFVVPYIQDKDVTILFDEASEIPHDISMALLTILAPNQRNTTFAFDDYVCEFDFTRQSFIFCTTEAQNVSHALLDRLKRIELEEYSHEQLAQIIQKGSKEVEYRNGVLLEMAAVSRGNARSANDLAADIKAFLAGQSTVFGRNEWESLKTILSIKPLGLNAGEINLLKHLKGNPDGVSLTALSARTGMSRESLQRDGELYLLKHGLFEVVAGKGRCITAKGLTYLKEIGL